MPKTIAHILNEAMRESPFSIRDRQNNDPVRISWVGLKAFWLLDYVEEHGLDVTRTQVAAAICSNPQAMRVALIELGVERPEDGPNSRAKAKEVGERNEELRIAVRQLHGLKVLARAYEPRRNERMQNLVTRWNLLKPEGFLKRRPPGHRRLTQQEADKIDLRVGPDLASRFQKKDGGDALKRWARRQYLTPNGVGEKIRKAGLLVIDGWTCDLAHEEAGLLQPSDRRASVARKTDRRVSRTGVSRVAMRKLFRRPLIIGKTETGKPARIVNPIFTAEEQGLILRRIGPRGRQSLLGLVWDGDQRVPDPKETWLVEAVYAMRLVYGLGPYAIVRITGLTRSEVVTMFTNRAYAAVVGAERWKARTVKLLHPGIKRGREVREEILQIVERKGDQRPSVIKRELRNIGIDRHLSTIAEHLQKLQATQQLVRRDLTQERKLETVKLLSESRVNDQELARRLMQRPALRITTIATARRCIRRARKEGLFTKEEAYGGTNIITPEGREFLKHSTAESIPQLAAAA